MPGELSGKAAIVGIGATDFSKNSGRSELRLASEAVLDALEDAGLTPADVDGMVTFTMDSNTEVAIARAIGIGELKFFSKIHHGGGAACATIQQAAIAVATGVADCVVAYRAFNERSGQRFGQVQLRLVENADSTGVDNSFSYPHGLSTPAAQVAMIAKRYMHLSGRDEQGLRGGVGGRPQTRRQESRRRTSTKSRSPLRITRIRGGSPSRCGCWTAVRRPTAGLRWW